MLLLFILAATLIAYFLLRDKNPTPPQPLVQPPAVTLAPRPPPTGAAWHWQDGGRHETEVVVEAAFQGVIAALAAAQGDSRAPLQAMLVPDADNRSIAVFIAATLVGYLAQEDARRLRRRLDDKDLSGQTTSCDAVLGGGGLWQGKRLMHVVRLDIAAAD
ncbi:MAG TPA: hypothetical protein DCW29_23990 [Janthinobacterium sp.]|nr:hypothetical protein [Janthinobacterium sp.]